MNTEAYELKSPHSEEQWRQYHDIRRRVLWESRGRSGLYDERHPDEHAPGHFPLLLVHKSEAIGVIRIDISQDRAILRRVAIREDVQRLGHGRRLMDLAGRFAQLRGCTHLYSYVDPGAVAFYEKCGFRRDRAESASAEYVGMEKTL